MVNNKNSCRHFLSVMGILGSGTLVAGSPMALLNREDAVDLKKQWKLFVTAFDGSSFGTPATEAITNIQHTDGHRFEQGAISRLAANNLLAMPTWIYWGNNDDHPSDMLVSFFEDKAPYKKIKTIHRFELEALVKLAAEQESQELLALLCKPATSAGDKLVFHMHISGRKKVMDIALQQNGINFQKQFFYNI